MIFLSPPHLYKHTKRYINQAIKSNYIAPTGKFIDRFEAEIMKYTHTKSAVALVNATSAIHLALRVLGIGEGDKVAVSSFTFVASLSPILYQKAIPVLIDSDKSWNMSYKLLKQAIIEHDIKAVIVTHLYGQMADIAKITKLCKKHNIYLIEDSAESLGATYKGKHSGTFGDFGVFSFNGNKIITNSSGGMLISNNRDYIKQAKFLSSQAKEDMPWYEHTTYGYNYRMSNILAAIGVAQMKVLNSESKKNAKYLIGIRNLLMVNLCRRLNIPMAIDGLRL